MKKGLLYVGTQSPKVISYLQEMLFRVFRLDIQVLGQVNLAGVVAPGIGRDGLLQGRDRAAIEMTLGEQFIGWLWRRAIDHGGTGQVDDSTCLMFGDSIKLVSEGGKAKEVSLKKGDPIESKAALTALAAGMRPIQTKLILKDADLEWTFGLSASGLHPSSMKLPPSPSNTKEARICDRVFLTIQALDALDARYKEFLEHWRVEGPEALEDGLKAWAADRRDSAGETEGEDEATALGDVI